MKPTSILVSQLLNLVLNLIVVLHAYLIDKERIRGKYIPRKTISEII